jgi:hypothetical protein
MASYRLDVMAHRRPYLRAQEYFQCLSDADAKLYSRTLLRRKHRANPQSQYGDLYVLSGCGGVGSLDDYVTQIVEW